MNDNSELKNEMQNLRRSVEKLEKEKLALKRLMSGSPDFMFVSRIDNFRFTEVNTTACKYYGYSHEEFLEMEIFDIEVSPPLKEQVRALYDETPEGAVLEVFGINKKKNGDTFPVHVRFLKLDEEFALANVRDITDLRKLEEELIEAREKTEAANIAIADLNADLKKRYVDETRRSANLQRELIHTADRERMRVGHDLHDGLGQQLTGISFLCRSLANELKGLSEDKCNKVGSITDLVNSAIDRTRRIAEGLTPLNPEERDLKSLLENLCLRSTQLFEIPCVCKSDDSLIIDQSAVLSHIYLIAQESILNSIKHSGCSSVTVRAVINDGRLTMTVTDDGKGIEMVQDESEHGMGLRIMKYRADMINGELNVANLEGGGSRTTLILKHENT